MTVVTSLANIVEAAIHYTVISIKSKIPSLVIVFGFSQGIVCQFFQVVEVGIVVRIIFYFQITGTYIIIKFLLGDDVINTPNCKNILDQNQI